MFDSISRWFTAGRDRDAARAQVDVVYRQYQGEYAALGRSRAEAATRQSALVAALVTDYYHADALAHLGGLGTSYQSGIGTGAVQALGHVTGTDTHTLQFRLEHGIPVTENWLAVNLAPVGARPRIVLRHRGGDIEVQERLTMLREQALIARRHPLAREYRRFATPTVVA